MPAPTVRILGIDPGLRVTGFGVIEKNGASLSYIASGCVKSGDADLADRLKTILAGLREIIGEHRPQQVALEKVFVNVNPASTLALGQARGTAICAAVDAGLPVSEYTALQVKQAVVGNGHAKKGQRPPQTPPTRLPAPFATRTAGRAWERSRRAGSA